MNETWIDLDRETTRNVLATAPRRGRGLIFYGGKWLELCRTDLKDNVVIVGHARLEAAKLLGLKDVPVTKVDLSENKAKAYRLADNKLNESDWEMNLVIEELQDLGPDM